MTLYNNSLNHFRTIKREMILIFTWAPRLYSRIFKIVRHLAGAPGRSGLVLKYCTTKKTLDGLFLWSVNIPFILFTSVVLFVPDCGS